MAEADRLAGAAGQRQRGQGARIDVARPLSIAGLDAGDGFDPGADSSGGGRGVVSWSILLVEEVDLRAAYAVAAAALSLERTPPTVTVARVAGLAVPGALVEVSVIAAVMR